jgi:hypothetical protein
MDYNFGDQNGVLLVNVSSKRATVEFSESFKTDKSVSPCASYGLL